MLIQPISLKRTCMAMRNKIYILCVSIYCAQSAYALTNDANSVKFSGYLDTSYNYLLRKNTFTSGIDDRLYDLEQNGFTLQQAAFTLAKQPTQGWGALLNVVAGRDANELAAYGWDPYFGSQTLALDIPQLYLQYAISSLTILAGKFITLAGTEQYDPIGNPNFSHSILDGFAQPSTHMGVRGIYLANNKLKLIAGINNGWNSIRDTSRQKTVELGVDYTFNPQFSLTAQVYSGIERLILRTAVGPTGRRNLIDIVATLKATEKLTLVANYDYGMQTKAALPIGIPGKAVWQGIAAYANYHWVDQWHTSLRGEIFADQDGYQTGVRQNWRELTATLAYLPIKHVELRAETRHDFSNVNSFVDTSGTGISPNQQSYALEGIYEF